MKLQAYNKVTVLTKMKQLRKIMENTRLDWIRNNDIRQQPRSYRKQKKWITCIFSAIDTKMGLSDLSSPSI